MAPTTDTATRVPGAARAQGAAHVDPALDVLHVQVRDLAPRLELRPLGAGDGERAGGELDPRPAEGEPAQGRASPQ
jgi:hypothetical protein